MHKIRMTLKDYLKLEASGMLHEFHPEGVEIIKEPWPIPEASEEAPTSGEEGVKTEAATTTQVGGEHYRKYAIQPMVYSMSNKLNAAQHTAIKYITRYKDKNGAEDLDKAIHTLQMLKEIEYDNA
jgi:hypothetical protein